MSRLKALVIDAGGIYSEVAVRLMRDCASVKYCTFSDVELAGKIGLGLDGIEHVDSPWGHLDNVDFIFCPDTNSGEIVEYLKKHNYPCAGAGSIEQIEVDRWYGRNLQKTNGMAYQTTKVATGVTELKEACKDPAEFFGSPEIKQFYVKVDNGYRGISESFKHYDFKTSEPRIDYIAYKASAFKEKIKFICEECLEGSEPGFDGITFDGEILYPCAAGYEIGKAIHIDRVYQESELPAAYKLINDGLVPEFKKKKTRMFFSAEFILGKDRIPYLLDPCMRLASPGGVAFQTELIENFTDVCYGLATGKKTNPIIKNKYALALPINCAEAEKGFVGIEFPKELRQWVKFTQGCKVGQDYYAVPPEPIVATVVALGGSVKEVFDLCKQRVEQVKGIGLKPAELNLDKIQKVINDGKLLGIPF